MSDDTSPERFAVNEDPLEVLARSYFEGMRAGVGMVIRFFNEVASDARVSPLADRDPAELSEFMLRALEEYKADRMTIIRTALLEMLDEAAS